MVSGHIKLNRFRSDGEDGAVRPTHDLFGPLPRSHATTLFLKLRTTAMKVVVAYLFPCMRI